MRRLARNARVSGFAEYPTWGEKEQTEFVNSVTEEALGKMLPFRTTQLSLADLMQHLVNHSTYHRGQVAVMMRQLDAKPLPTDFHLFLLECARAAATTR